MPLIFPESTNDCNAAPIRSVAAGERPIASASARGSAGVLCVAQEPVRASAASASVMISDVTRIARMDPRNRYSAVRLQARQAHTRSRDPPLQHGIGVAPEIDEPAVHARATR